jgi:hypothetical protein
VRFDAPVAISLRSVVGDAHFVSRSPYMSLVLAPDGKRVAVFPMPEASADDKGQGSGPVTVLQNFFDELSTASSLCSAAAWASRSRRSARRWCSLEPLSNDKAPRVYLRAHCQDSLTPTTPRPSPQS